MSAAGDTHAEAIRAIAVEGGQLGIEIVDVAGHVEDVTRRAREQSARFHELRRTAMEVLDCDRAMAKAADAALDVARSAGKEVASSKRTVEVALEDIRALVDAVKSTSARLAELRGSLEEVGKTVSAISGIARHTNILALNASVEAARSGEAGAGFAVIAQAVKSLAQQTREATDRVDAAIRNLAGQAGKLADESQHETRQAEAVGTGAATIATFVDFVANATRDIDQRAGEIVTGARAVEERVGAFLGDVEQLDASVTASSTSLDAASGRLNGLLHATERILGLSAETGLQTADAPFVELAVASSQVISMLFEQELESGRASLADFFDDRYVPLPNTDPQQFTTRFTAITDRLLPDVLEPPLDRVPGVVFVVAVDKNGYLPTHNRKFSHPQRHDPVWNTANCRNRRKFDDRVGLAAARNTAPFLLQCYRRDMGGGNYALMKDVSVPVFIDGRHWGALRVGYKA